MAVVVERTETACGAVTAAKGFAAAAVHAGIRRSKDDLARVQGTDSAEIGLFEDATTGRAIVICAIDNLGKGAAGQAVQNANLALGLDETAGLRLSGVLV